jgi:hypothetical protein
MSGASGTNRLGSDVLFPGVPVSAIVIFPGATAVA